MNLDNILAELKRERERLNDAIAALERVGGGATRGRPVGSGATGVRGRRTMSAAARKRISQAMKARWAQRKKSKAA